MAYIRNSVGLLASLLDTINAGKSEGKIKNLVLNYSISNTLNSTLVPHSKGEGIQVIEGTSITSQDFQKDVAASFQQWEEMLNLTYSKYLNLTFKRDDSSEDLVVSVGKPVNGDIVSLELNSIVFKKGVKWASYKARGEEYIIPNLIFIIGLYLGLRPSFTQDSPMTLNKLKVNYIRRYNITVSSEGIFKNNGLISSKELNANIQLLYGNSDSTSLTIYGDMDIYSDTFDPNATKNTTAFSNLTPNPNPINYAPINYGITRSSEDGYILTSADGAYPLNSSLLSTLPSEVNGLATILSGSLLSKVISVEGVIRYYVLVDTLGNIDILNRDGQRLSELDASAVSTEMPYNNNLSKGAYTIQHYNVGDVDHIYTQSTEGNWRVYSLNITHHQLDFNEEVVLDCGEDLDYPVPYGNVYETVTIEGGLANLHNLRGETIVGGFNELGEIPNVSLLSTDITELVSYNPSAPVNTRQVIINTRRGFGLSYNSTYENLFSLQLFSPYTTMFELPLRSLANIVVVNSPTIVDGSYVYNSPSYESLRENVVIAKIIGFTFSEEDLGLYAISQNKWQASDGQFSDPYEDIETLETIDIDNPSDAMQRYAQLPIVASPNDLLDTSGFYSGINNIDAFVSGGFYQTESRISTLVAYAVKHGFILLKVSDYFGQLIPPADGGIENHVPGGDLTLAESSGGYTPVSMAFSTYGNFLYTILEDPEDPTKRKICIFNTSNPEGDIAGTAIVIDNPFIGDLSRVNLEEDGSIYFYSQGTSEYCKITNPDLQESVSIFEVYHSTMQSSTVFDILPIGDLNAIASEGPTSLDPGVSTIFNNNEYISYISSPTVGAISLDNGAVTPINIDTPLAGDEYWITSATEDHPETSEIVLTAAISSAGTLKVYLADGSIIYQAAATANVNRKGAVAILPLISPLNSYAILQSDTDGVKYVIINFDPTDNSRVNTVGTLAIDTAANIINTPTDTNRSIGAGMSVIRLSYYDYIMSTVEVDSVTGEVYLYLKNLNRESLGVDSDGKYIVPTATTEPILLHTHDTLREDNIIGSGLTTVISVPSNQKRIAIATSYNSKAMLSVGNLDTKTRLVDNITQIDLYSYLMISGSSHGGYRINSMEFSSTGSHLIVLISDNADAVLGQGVNSKILQIEIIDQEGVPQLGQPALIAPFLTEGYGQDDYPILNSTFTSTEGGIPDVLNPTVKSNSRITSLFSTKVGRIATINGNNSNTFPTIGIVINPGNSLNVRIAHTAIALVPDYIPLKLINLGGSNPMDPTYDEGGHGGPGGVGSNDDPVFVYNWGCMDPRYCTFDSTANQHDESSCMGLIQGDCPCVNIEGAGMVGSVLDDCGICVVADYGVGYTDNASYALTDAFGSPLGSGEHIHQYSGLLDNLNNLGMSIWDPNNLNLTLSAMAVNATNISGTNFGTNVFAYEANSCGQCTEQGFGVINGMVPSDCVAPWCQSDPSLCEFGGCVDTAACNGVTQAYADANGITHYPSLCSYVPPGCDCNEAGTVTSIVPSEGYCGECIATEALPGQQGYNPGNVTLVDTGITCGCDLVPFDGYCDCGGNILVGFCDCGTGNISAEYADQNICNCEGHNPTDIGYGPYCDCDGVYNEVTHCDCNTVKQPYYLDANGNGLGDIGTQAFFCPGEEPDGYITSLGADCPTEEQDCFGQCPSNCDWGAKFNDCGECVAVGSDLTDCCTEGNVYSPSPVCTICDDDFDNGLLYAIGEVTTSLTPLGQTMYNYNAIGFLETISLSTCDCGHIASNNFLEHIEGGGDSEYDACGSCGGEATLGGNLSDTSVIIDSIEYCSCLMDSPAEVGGCCPGFVRDCLSQLCVPSGSQTITYSGCACGEGPLDSCGVCGGSNTTGCYLNDCEIYCDCAGNITDCAGVCGGTSTEDSCGVCGGNNSTCLECGDPLATNYNSDAVNTSNSVCEYLTLGEVIDAVVIDTTGVFANSTGVVFTSEAEIDLDNILYQETVISTANGEQILIDNQAWTSKCQVIGYEATGGTCIFYAENPLVNAEISYDFENFPSSNLVDEGANPIIVAAGTSGGYYAHYYFRISENFLLTTDDIEELFFGQVGAIASVIDTAENLSYTSNGQWANTNTPILSGNNVYNGGTVENIYEDGIHTSFPSYNVYKVTPSRDINGIPHTFSVDFCQFLINGTEPPDCEGRSLPSQLGKNAFRASVASVDEPLNSAITGIRIDMDVYVDSITDLNDIKWVVYSDTNLIVKESETLSLADAVDGVIRKSYSLSDINNCAWFLPIGFTENDVWKNVNLTVNIECDPVHNLRFGYSETKFGSVLLKSGEPLCKMGCASASGSVITEYCVARVKKDVREFTDIRLVVETSQAAAQNIFLGHSSAFIKVYNLATGKVLASVTVGDSGLMFKKTFRIDKDTRVGVSVNNPSNSSVVYKLISESGEIILNKKLN